MRPVPPLGRLGDHWGATEAVLCGAGHHCPHLATLDSRRCCARGACPARSRRGRPAAVRPAPAHALTEDERQAVLEPPSAGSGTTLQPDTACPERSRRAALPPGQIVPRLADEGVCLASESTFYRVLRAHDLQHSVLSLSKHYRGAGQSALLPHTAPTNRIKCGAGTSPGC